MTRRTARRLVGGAIALVLTVEACGGSGATPAPAASTATPAPTPTLAVGPAATPTVLPTVGATTAAAACPSAATVGAALGITVSAPVGIAGGGKLGLPAGATAIVCDYHGTTLNVIMDVLANVSPSTIAQFSSKFPVPYVSVAGVGDQARSFQQSLGGGRDNEGVVATKGSTLVAITATATPATLTQLESLVASLL